MVTGIREVIAEFKPAVLRFKYCIFAFKINGGARGVMVIVAGYGQGDTSSNPGPDTLGKGMNPIILPPD